MLVIYLELMGHSLGLCWDDLEAMRDNSTEILKLCRIRAH